MNMRYSCDDMTTPRRGCYELEVPDALDSSEGNATIERVLDSGELHLIFLGLHGGVHVCLHEDIEKFRSKISELHVGMRRVI